MGAANNSHLAPMHSGVFNVPCQPNSGPQKSGRPSSAFLRRIGHSAAGKEMRPLPPRLTIQNTSGVANWPPSVPVFLDIRYRVPGVQPLFQTLIALSGTDQAKTRPTVGPLLPKNDLMGGQDLAQIVVH